MMNATEIQAHARKLYDVMGPKALAEAAQKAKSHETDGRKDEAENWRRIEQALRQMQGPRAS